MLFLTHKRPKAQLTRGEGQGFMVNFDTDETQSWYTQSLIIEPSLWKSGARIGKATRNDLLIRQHSLLFVSWLLSPLQVSTNVRHSPNHLIHHCLCC